MSRYIAPGKLSHGAYGCRFEHNNLDLLFAVPDQSLAQWEADLREAARLGPDHISTYCLTLKRTLPSTQLTRKGPNR